jgi:hypothetical protein
VFTHFSLSLTVYEARVKDRSPAFAWKPLAEAAPAMPSVFRKAVAAR